MIYRVGVRDAVSVAAAGKSGSPNSALTFRAVAAIGNRDGDIVHIVPVIQRDVAGRQLRIDDPHVVVFENDFVLRFLFDSDGIRADGHLHVNVGPTTLKAAAAFTR